MHKPPRERRGPSVRARELREALFPVVEGLNTVDAGHIIGVDASTVRRYIRDGKLPAAKQGRDFVITEEDLRAFVLEKQERDKAERAEAARTRRIQQEIDRYIGQARAARQTSQVALAWCPTCGHRSPVTLDIDLFDGTIFGVDWVGNCRFCPDERPLGKEHSFYTSLEDEEAAAARTTTQTDAPPLDVAEAFAQLSQLSQPRKRTATRAPSAAPATSSAPDTGHGWPSVNDADLPF